MRTALALALIIAAPAVAHAAGLPFSFSTVDEVSRDPNGVVITGIREGQSSQTTYSVPNSYYSANQSYESMTGETCYRLATLAMDRPGRYTFTVVEQSTYVTCKLKRNNP